MTYSIKDLQEKYAVGEHTILRWIHQGDLIALDVSRTKGGRPKWRVTAESLVAFEQTRSSSPPAPKPSRRRGKSDGVIEFYK